MNEEALQHRDHCGICDKWAGDIYAYQVHGTRDYPGLPLKEAALQYMLDNEGTYCDDNGRFLCDDCYIRAGMPTASGRGWKASEENLQIARSVAK